ncbi:unnamed protein product [Schistocephalus solidus]|uniref:glutaminyl-peptide cyclotransferase n=1 Tax=Schistocephalus solidus TaxID=70667 RepID=A0A3P7DHQ6_SCHSO|nr:unnamed protein product [Schistocephalus solidus]
MQHTITESHLRVLSRLLMNVNFTSVLKHINLIRPVGSEKHHAVRKYITSFLRELNWYVLEDAFTQWTVLGMQNFTNIISVNRPDLPRRLALACHYDSKMINGFYGTTDSAVPCSMMLVLAKLDSCTYSRVALQLLFFDGEEAFISWSPEDSIYGSRHMAEHTLQSTSGSGACTDLSRIDLLVLLDLLGAASTHFPRYSHCDESVYRMMIDIGMLSCLYIANSNVCM